MQTLGSYPRPTESETLGYGIQQLFPQTFKVILISIKVQESLAYDIKFKFPSLDFKTHNPGPDNLLGLPYET